MLCTVNAITSKLNKNMLCTVKAIACDSTAPGGTAHCLFAVWGGWCHPPHTVTISFVVVHTWGVGGATGPLVYKSYTPSVFRAWGGWCHLPPFVKATAHCLFTAWVGWGHPTHAVNTHRAVAFTKGGGGATKPML